MNLLKLFEYFLLLHRGKHPGDHSLSSWLQEKGTGSELEYPTDLAPRGNQTDTYRTANGSLVTVEDPYRFLENPSSKETQAWV